MLAPGAPEAIAEAGPLRATFGPMTPVFLVDQIEPSLDFWVNCLDFEATLSVPGEDGLEFVRLSRDDVQVIYRTRSSVGRMSPEALLPEAHLPWVILSLPVSDLDAILPRIDGVEVVVPLRESDFGIRELYIREPSGRIVALIEQSAA